MEKIIFYSLDAAPLFDKTITTPIGGAELRAFNFAKYLAKNGYEVHMIVSDLSKSRIVKEGVIIRPVHYYKTKKKLFSKIKRRLIYLAKYKGTVAYEQFLRYSEFFLIKPRYICLFGTTGTTISATLAAKEAGREVALFIASDEEVNFENTTLERTRLDTSFADVQRCLNAAGKIFVQNVYQKQAITQKFHKEAHLLLNPIDVKKKFSGTVKDYVLWVGKSSWYKNPKLFVELANLFKTQKFLMICNEADPSLFAEIKANLPDNCVLLEHVSPDEIESCFYKCEVFVNTSDFEGFPNTFLQAAKYGKPIISYNVNPNEFLTENDCGIFCHGNYNELIKALSHLLEDETVYEAKGRNALVAVKKYDIEHVGKFLIEIFNH